MREAECALDKSFLYRFAVGGGSVANMFRENCIKKLASRNASNRNDVCASHGAACRAVGEVYGSAVRDMQPFKSASHRPDEP